MLHHVKRSRNPFGTVCNKKIDPTWEGTTLHWMSADCVDCLRQGSKEGVTSTNARLVQLTDLYVKTYHATQSSFTGTVWCGNNDSGKLQSSSFDAISCESCLHAYMASNSVNKDKALIRLNTIVVMRAALFPKPGSKIVKAASGKRLIPMHPHKCPRCGSPAYVGFMTTLDCSNGCR